MTFGRQRSPRDILALVLLLTGFCALALAFWVLTANWAGVLLPIGFLIGMYAQLRGEVRQIELRPETLVVRTFFREYPMPRAHIRRVVRTSAGVAVDVLSGARYEIAPPGANADEVYRAVEAWLQPAG